MGSESDCLEACVASVLELDLSQIPNFFAGDEDWFVNLEKFLAEFDLQPLRLDAGETRDHWTPSGYHLIWGTTRRSTFHSVVGWAGEMVHDPHPDRTGLLADEVWMVFISRLANNSDMTC